MRSNLLASVHSYIQFWQSHYTKGSQASQEQTTTAFHRLHKHIPSPFCLMSMSPHTLAPGQKVRAHLTNRGNKVSPKYIVCCNYVQGLWNQPTHTCTSCTHTCTSCTHTCTSCTCTCTHTQIYMYCMIMHEFTRLYSRHSSCLCLYIPRAGTGIGTNLYMGF